MDNKNKSLVLFIVLILWQINFSSAQTEKYKPNKQSLQNHEVPEWYNDAKLGIFIHWGLYSVPAWAPLSGELGTLDMESWFKNNAYAEWYLNTLRITGSPTEKHHLKEYGEDFDYYDFSKTFNTEVKKWKPKEWASFIKDVHAKYVVLTTKHHDGFLLWPSGILNPYLPSGKNHTQRDVVKELAEAVREEGMKMGLYYSGGIDWTFNPIVIKNEATFRLSAPPKTQQYADYANHQYKELIDNYKPDILWNDITYPERGNEFELFAYYYNQVPEGVINDRWNRDIHDFTTPEYTSYSEITPKKWEATRGIDFSFGYNQNSSEKQMLSVDELIKLFVDIVSKNGNLLINIGPKPDGTIPEDQKERLKGLGKWLDVNGEAIFGTRPWVRSSDSTAKGVPLRFTFKEGKLFMILLEHPSDSQIVIPNLIIEENSSLKLLGNSENLSWENTERGAKISLPRKYNDQHAYTISFSRQPTLKMKK